MTFIKISIQIKLSWNLIFPLIVVYDINCTRPLEGELRTSNCSQNFKIMI